MFTPASDPAATQGSPIDRPNRLTAAGLMVRTLKAHGVDTVFGYPGGAIMPIYDALPGCGMTHILTRHEQAAAFAADAYGRVTGRPGVCMATSGPGATNLMTGLANAALDSVPMVAICGQVARGVMGTDAFQEVDTMGMSLSLVKHSFLVEDPAEIGQITAQALTIAAEGRPGPVLIDVPKDVALADVAPQTPEPGCDQPGPPPSPTLIRAAEAMIEAAERPLLYLGGGIAIAGAVAEARALADRTGLPAVATLKALGTLPTGHPQFLGMLGMHGTRAANEAVQAADLLITIGARFDDRATGKLDGFAPHARILHLDADHAEIGKLRPADLSLTSDLGATLSAIRPGPLTIADWTSRLYTRRAETSWDYNAPGTKIYGPALLRDLSALAGPDAIISCDVGQHQMWVAQHCAFAHPRHHLTSAGLGAMGFGIPAGIGALYADPDKPVITVTGDGSIMMNIQELATLNRYRLPLKIVLLDNAMLGMVRQWQDLFYQGRRSEVDLSDNPDFALLARSFGLAARTLEARADQAEALDWLMAQSGPCLLHVKIDPDANVWPLVPPGASNDAMMEECAR